MRTLYNSVVDVVEESSRPTIAAHPRGISMHGTLPFPALLLPVESKELQGLSCQASPSSFSVQHLVSNEVLYEADKSTLLQTSCEKGDADVLTGVSARLESDSLDVMLQGESKNKGCSLAGTTRWEDGTSPMTSTMLHDSVVLSMNNCCEKTQVFVDPVTIQRSSGSLRGSVRLNTNLGHTAQRHCYHQQPPQKQQIQKQIQDVQNPSSPHTPLGSIVSFTLAQASHHTSIPETPQKSLRCRLKGQLTPATHRRPGLLHNTSTESADLYHTTLRSTHFDYLTPNRNPWSPCCTHSDVWSVKLPVELDEAMLLHVRSQTMDTCSTLSTSSPYKDVYEFFTPPRADVLAVVCAQTVQARDTTSQLVRSSPRMSFKGKESGRMSRISSTNKNCYSSETIYGAQEEVGCMMGGVCSSEVAEEKSSSMSRISLQCCLSDDSRRCVEAEATHTRINRRVCPLELLQSEERCSCTTPNELAQRISLGNSSPLHLQRTRSFHDPQDCESEMGSTPACISHPNTVKQSSVYPFAPLLWKPDGEDAHVALHSSNSVMEVPDDVHTSGASSVVFCGSDECTILRTNGEDGEDKEAKNMAEVEEGELEPGDRFRLHHRYQFLHWLPWRNAHGFVPIHLDYNGTVWLATHRIDGLPYAVKEVLPLHQSSLPTELECLTLGNAPVTSLQQQAADHIVRYYTVSPYRVVSDDSHEVTAFLLQTEYFFMGNVMEWALDPQNLRGTPYNLPPESFWCGILQHGLLALEALHSVHIVHGNPLPFNIFIFSPGHYKLGGFGTATKWPQEYPPGTPSSLLPPSSDDGVSWTPYEVDVYIFARGIQQLLSECILKRKACCEKQNEDSDEETFFTSDDMLAFALFKENRAKGYHGLSDHVWYALQSALREKSIQVVLNMLQTPSHALWGARCLFKAEYLRLLRRKHQLQKALHARSQTKAWDGKTSRGSPHDLPDGHPDEHSAHSARCLHGAASSRSDVSPCHPLKVAQCPPFHLSISPSTPSSMWCHQSSSCGLGRSTCTGDGGRCCEGSEPEMRMLHVPPDTRCGLSISAQQKELNCFSEDKRNPLPCSCNDFESLLTMFPPGARKRCKFSKIARRNAAGLPCCNGNDVLSPPEWPVRGDIPRLHGTRSTEDATQLFDHHAQDEGMLWTAHRIMNVMQWSCEPQVFAACHGWGLSADGVSCASWRAMRPFTSLE